MPGLALQFALVGMGAALRGTGIVKPTMIVQSLTLILNTILAPVLIAGWGTGHPLGVKGAALASSISISVGAILLLIYFARLEKYVHVDRALWKPNFATWKRMFNLGLPAGGEFMMMFLVVGIIYWCIRDFGAAAQAGFGIGSRVMQSIFLPAMAVAFAASPIAGQNFGARQAQRVRETFRTATIAGIGIMSVMTLLCQWKAPLLVGAFTNDPHVIQVARAVPEDHLLEFCRHRNHLHLLRPVPGDRQHVAGATQQCRAHSDVLRPGGVVVNAAVGAARTLLAPVGGDDCVAGGHQPVAAARRIPQTSRLRNLKSGPSRPLGGGLCQLRADHARYGAARRRIPANIARPSWHNPPDRNVRLVRAESKDAVGFASETKQDGLVAGWVCLEIV